MKVSQYLLNTEKETPKDAQLVSHQLMLRAGLIRPLASGLYAWLPIGLRVFRKIEAIIRRELAKANAIEVFLPHIVPGELWKETGRWEKYGGELLRIKDRHDRDFCFGPTHEETIVALARQELKSYKQLPLNLYQIQTKFRDETRPRFGVMRAREFCMKDAYSFHLTSDCLQKTYRAMHDAYCRIFTAIGLRYKVVEADPGAIGGQITHEFHVLAEAGEDNLFFSTESPYAANVEKATSLAPKRPHDATLKALEKIHTPHAKTIADLAKHHHLPAQESVKTLVMKNNAGELIALILRGDHELNPIKAAALAPLAQGSQFATEEEIRKVYNAGPGSLGVVHSPLPLYVDAYAAALVNFSCGANIDDYHFTQVNWDRDVPSYTVADLRNVMVGDISPDGKGHLEHARGIEVGHIFQLNQQYSKAMNATVLDSEGQNVHPYMGCYGIGVGRIVAAIIEQHYDENGIIWPSSVAPFDLALVPIGYHQNAAVKEKTDEMYESFVSAGIDVILDDRNERPGAMFKDMDLIGIPHRVVISEKLILRQSIEYKGRQASEPQVIPLDQAVSFIQSFFN
jgi:prolyl-tRNA synthetase